MHAPATSPAANRALDALDTAVNRHEFNALNKRIDHLENLIATPPDVTGAVRQPERHKRHGVHGSERANLSRGN